MRIRICHLYPHTMNTYGDTGNILCLQKRSTWRGIDVDIVTADIGDTIPNDVDLYFFGGGQDAAQGIVGADLVSIKGDRLTHDSLAGIPILAICGGYQLLGVSYYPFNETPINGLGILPVVTHASKDRMIGNVILQTNPGLAVTNRSTLVGFENHSGKTTFLDSTAEPLGTVVVGNGNNGTDKTEGCIVRNTIGCYLHGSLLPKNPHLADYLIEHAIRQHAHDFVLTSLNDTTEWQAHDTIVGRYM